VYIQNKIIAILKRTYVTPCVLLLIKTARGHSQNEFLGSLKVGACVGTVQGLTIL